MLATAESPKEDAHKEGAALGYLLSSASFMRNPGRLFSHVPHDVNPRISITIPSSYKIEIERTARIRSVYTDLKSSTL